MRHRPSPRIWTLERPCPKELFARMESVGREIENRVTGNDSSRLKDQRARRPLTTAQWNAKKLSPHPCQPPAPMKP